MSLLRMAMSPPNRQKQFVLVINVHVVDVDGVDAEQM
jgi:hypothetical protein